MNHIVRKAFWNYEKEEKWLNAMAAKGMALTDYSWCRYVFEETASNQYIYRIDLLNQMPTHPESIAYLRFLEENGVECVATYKLWVYLRKKASEGPFDIYTDIESKITHYKRVYTVWNTLMGVAFVGGISNIVIGIINLNIGEVLGNFSCGNIIIGLFLLPIGFLSYILRRPLSKKLKKLEKEKIIRE